jgi:hypothetical protein
MFWSRVYCSIPIEMIFAVAIREYLDHVQSVESANKWQEVHRSPSRSQVLTSRTQ